MIISVATPSKYIALTPMAVDLRRIGKGILVHLYNKETKDPLSKDETTIIIEGACQAEVHTLSNLYTACFTTVKPTIAQKIAPSSSSPKERWSKTPASLHSNHHLEK
jgi:hypothetical protein